MSRNILSDPAPGGLLTPKFPRDKKFMRVTDLMISLFRLLLIGIAFFTASHLAVRGAVGAELELGGVSTVEPPVAEDLASPQVDSDPWADSFLPTPGRLGCQSCRLWETE